jgi:hypothetical protein
MATASAARRPRPLPDDIPVLRWTYRRDGEIASCELALAHDLSAYELRMSPARLLGDLPAELFDDAVSAFRQQERVERALIDQGWHLDRFERDRQPL